MHDLGIVVIGRNEGRRLERTLCSVRGPARPCIYVDSGSTDDSVAIAEHIGVDVLRLDPARPFTAARGRNEGLERLLQAHPDLRFIQFVDGDTAIAQGWLESARGAHLDEPGLAAVCGKLTERDTSSLYARLCAVEWDRPAGLTDSCGGNMLVRVAAFRDVGGFRADMAAGEEPELCARWRARGYSIRRLDAPMGEHDAGMVRFSQWWTRMVRGGRAWVEESVLHGKGPARLGRRQVRSAVFWGLALPLLILLSAFRLEALAIGLCALYPVQATRIASRQRRSGRSWSLAWLVAGFLLLGKIPEAWGVVSHGMTLAIRGPKRDPAEDANLSSLEAGGGHRGPSEGVDAESRLQHEQSERT